MGLETIAIVGLGLSAAGTVMQMEARSDAKDAARRRADAQAQQAALEQKRADIANARQLRTAIRQARIARASLVNQGANAGTSFSSGVVGGAGSVVSQSNANVGFFNQMGEVNAGITDTQRAQAAAMADYGAAQGDAAIGGALGNLGGTIFQSAGGFKTIFN